MNKFKKILLLLSILNALIFPESLQSVYDSSEPSNGYDNHLILDPNILYTGGIGIFEGDVLIDCNGAIIDLNNQSGIWVYADNQTPASLDIQYCNIINGEYYALSYGGTSTGLISNCNLIRNAYGIKLFDNSYVNIENTNIIDNEIYGVAIYSTTPTCIINYTNSWNNGEADWMENCPG